MSDRRPVSTDSAELCTPCLVLDLDAVRERYAEFGRALPGAELFYAVKANPAPRLVAFLVGLGARFDVASRPELELCLAAGARPADISYGSTVKKERDIAFAHRSGVRRFAVDSAAELAKIARCAPGAEVVVRVTCTGAGSCFPLDRKFGCSPAAAASLLLDADAAGLRAAGVSFHVGSQQLDPGAWRAGIADAAEVFRRVRARGLRPDLLDLGGGFPAHYDAQVRPLSDYGDAIRDAVAAEFGDDRPELMIEPGRGLVADAGTLYSEVVLVSDRDGDAGPRWVYLDVGRFGGLAETEGELVRYPIRTAHDDGPRSPVVLAGPTCDSADVLYRRHPYLLPDDLCAGDVVRLLHTGAYTASYSSVGFNGFAPLRCVCTGDPAAGGSGMSVRAANVAV
ncbi:ornithine decarboxylase [Pseudonocardia sp. TMWB2A]|uniref:type III PLP-dependent enzyme n=1 Tax=unclassified Pseudonocardia TaxID=2619320 RepID=UPI001CF6C554|nr:type III PLP-dependent enzyme [Pseudonocardia sp. ICBG162]